VEIQGQAVNETLSVALCTYNGAQHLPALLDSLAGQKRLPNELLVCDDGSTDATQELIAENTLRLHRVHTRFRDCPSLARPHSSAQPVHYPPRKRTHLAEPMLLQQCHFRQP